MPEINLNNFENEMRRLMQEIHEEAEADLDAVLAAGSEALVHRLQTGVKHGGRTPEDTGDYAAGWEERQETRGVSKVRIVHNANKPQLTHMLEYGRDGVSARPHIRPAIEDTQKEIIDNLKKRL